MVFVFLVYMKVWVSIYTKIAFFYIAPCFAMSIYTKIAFSIYTKIAFSIFTTWAFLVQHHDIWNPA